LLNGSSPAGEGTEDQKHNGDDENPSQCFDGKANPTKYEGQQDDYQSSGHKFLLLTAMKIGTHPPEPSNRQPWVAKLINWAVGQPN
jgi:hypothetical protein